MRITDAAVSALNATPVRRSNVGIPSPELTSAKAIKSTVTISGEAHMKQRLFQGSDHTYKQPLKTTNLQSSTPTNVSFLTRSDRSFLGQVYEYAQEQGADLGFADELGRGLADYRANEKVVTPLGRGKTLDREGHRVSFSFTDKDAAIAKRVLASDAMKTTQLDHGFIRKAMDKDYGAKRDHNFEFMEKVVNKFSAKGDDSPLGVMFAKHSNIEKNYIQHTSKEKYKFKPGVDQLVEKTKGKGKGKAAIVRDPSSATPATLKDILRQIIFNAIGSSKRNGLPSLADYLMRNR